MYNKINFIKNAFNEVVTTQLWQFLRDQVTEGHTTKVDTVSEDVHCSVRNIENIPDSISDYNEENITKETLTTRLENAECAVICEQRRSNESGSIYKTNEVVLRHLSHL
jgi:hypothetical protein